MKIKTTKKELNQNYNYIIRGGYCETIKRIYKSIIGGIKND